jgi:hypothetical protein
LCLALGELHPDLLLERLTSKQFGEWVAFYSIDPFGDQRGDLQAAIVAATVSNRLRNKTEKPAQPIDFMPFYREPEQKPEQIKNTLRSILSSFHDKDRNDKH